MFLPTSTNHRGTLMFLQTTTNHRGDPYVFTKHNQPQGDPYLFYQPQPTIGGTLTFLSTSTILENIFWKKSLQIPPLKNPKIRFQGGIYRQWGWCVFVFLGFLEKLELYLGRRWQTFGLHRNSGSKWNNPPPLNKGRFFYARGGFIPQFMVPILH